MHSRVIFFFFFFSFMEIFAINIAMNVFCVGTASNVVLQFCGQSYVLGE